MSGAFSLTFGLDSGALAGSGLQAPSTSVRESSRAIRINMACYDEFAWFYNRYWNEEFHSLAFPILERIWLPRVPDGGRVLDVCCGTGYLARLLGERGFRVAGIDISPEMVRYARESAPAAEFTVGDIAKTKP